jgi:hypothetical protein
MIAKSRPLGRPRSRLDENIIMDLKETGWESVDWIYLSQTDTTDGLLETW